MGLYSRFGSPEGMANGCLLRDCSQHRFTLSARQQERELLYFPQDAVPEYALQKDSIPSMSASEAPREGATRPPTEHLQGIVERVTYHAEDSGYTVARLKVPSHADLVTIVGSFPAISAGQTLRVTGVWREHPKFGAQFQVLQARETKPATLTGVEKYLGSGLIKGIGPVTAKRIVAHFGLETLTSSKRRENG